MNNNEPNSREDREFRYRQGRFTGKDNRRAAFQRKPGSVAGRAAAALRASQREDSTPGTRQRHRESYEQLRRFTVDSIQAPVEFHRYRGPATVRKFADLSYMVEPDNGENPRALFRVGDKREAERLLATHPTRSGPGPRPSRSRASN